MSISINRFTMSECRTRLVYNVDERLCVIPKEARDRVARIVTRENGLDQGGEFLRSERASDQTFTGCSVKFEKEKESGSNQHSAQDGDGGAEDVPLLDAEVAAVSTGARLLFSAQPS
jgi:hypothetical protein